MRRLWAALALAAATCLAAGAPVQADRQPWDQRKISSYPLDARCRTPVNLPVQNQYPVYSYEIPVVIINERSREAIAWAYADACVQAHYDPNPPGDLGRRGPTLATLAVDLAVARQAALTTGGDPTGGGFCLEGYPPPPGQSLPPTRTPAAAPSPTTSPPNSAT